MASHSLNSCIYQQKIVRKYPLSQETSKEINPKALCHLQAVSIFASSKIPQRALQRDRADRTTLPFSGLSVTLAIGGKSPSSSESFQALLRVIARV